MASQTTIPPTMRAWTYSTPGTYREVLKMHTIPSPKPPTGDQVMIRIAYCGLNPGDIKIMPMLPALLRPNNSIPAIDFSGTIVALGPSTPENLRLDMKVFGMMGTPALLSGEGTLCEYICISPKRDMIAPIPEGVSLEDASSLGTAGVMAFLSCKHGGIKEGNGYRVLVNGGSGGCGSAFVQVIVGMGAREVVATCSAPNEELVKSLGASKTINYRAHTPLHAYLAKEYADQPFDFILDTVGNQELYTHSPSYLKEDGVFLNIGDFTHGTLRTLLNWIANYYWPRWLGGTPRKFVMFAAGIEQSSVEYLVRFVKEGKIRAVIERCFAFEEALDALDVVGTRRVRGRVVVKVEE